MRLMASRVTFGAPELAVTRVAVLTAIVGSGIITHVADQEVSSWFAVYGGNTGK